MQQRRVVRAAAVVLAAVVALLVVLGLSAGAAVAKPSHPGHPGHGNSARPHSATPKAAQHGRANAAAHGGLGGLLDSMLGKESLLNHALPAVADSAAHLVSTVGSAVTSTVTKTTGTVTTIVDGHAGSGTTPPSHPTPPAHASAPAHTPAPAHPKAKPTRATSGAPSAHGSTDAAAVRPAPLNGPTLVAGTAGKQPAAHERAVPDVPRVEAMSPTTLLTAPGTGVLVAVLFGFALGVCAMVYGAGRRGRRAN